MARQWRQRAWILGGLVVAACGLNPQPEPPAADTFDPSYSADSGGPALGAEGGASASMGGAGILGSGASMGVGTGGVPAAGGGFTSAGGASPMDADAGAPCPGCGANLDGGADGAASPPTDAGSD